MAPGGHQPVSLEEIKNAAASSPEKIPQATTAVRKQQRSGKRSAHQLTGHGCTGKLAW